MPAWNDVSGEGNTMVAAADALATALGAADGAMLTNMQCSRNAQTGKWVCVILKFSP